MLYVTLLKASSFFRIKIEQKHWILMIPFCFMKFTYESGEDYPSNMPSVSKKRLSALMKRKTLNLNEKIKLIDFAKKESHLWVPKT